MQKYLYMPPKTMGYELTPTRSYCTTLYLSSAVFWRPFAYLAKFSHNVWVSDSIGLAAGKQTKQSLQLCLARQQTIS